MIEWTIYNEHKVWLALHSSPEKCAENSPDITNMRKIHHKTLTLGNAIKGTFDPFDIAVMALGALSAYFVLAITTNKRVWYEER